MILENLTFEQYLGMKAASSTLIKNILSTSPAHAVYDSKETKATALGTLTHELVFEPERPSIFVVLPNGANLGSNAAKEKYRDALLSVVGTVSEDIKGAPGVVLGEQIKELTSKIKEAGMETISQEDYDTARTMRDNIMNHPLAGRLVSAPGRSELTFTAIDDLTGCVVKGRADRFPDSVDCILDLKTTRTVGDKAWKGELWKYRYDIQAALYEWIVRKNGESRRYVNIIVETEHPLHAVRVRDFGDIDIEEAWKDINKALPVIAKCLETGDWPTYEPVIETIQMRK